MRFGINTFLFTSPFTTQSTKLFKQFKQWGFDTVEIPIEDPSHIDAAQVKSELDKQGLVCGSVCACLGPDRDLRGTPRQQRDCLAYLTRLLDQMIVLDCPSLVGPVYSSVGRAEAVPPAEYQRQWKTVVRNLKKVCQLAEKRGRQICMEPLNRFETDFINTCDQALQMLKDVGSPALKLHLDTFHMNIEEKSLPGAIRTAGPLLRHMHCSENDRGAPGSGHVDWEGVFAALRDVGYDQWLVIESFVLGNEAIAKAAAIWRDIEPSGDDLAQRGLAFLRKMTAA